MTAQEAELARLRLKVNDLEKENKALRAYLWQFEHTDKCHLDAYEWGRLKMVRRCTCNDLRNHLREEGWIPVEDWQEE